MKINAESAKFLGLDQYEKNILNTLSEKRTLIADVSKQTQIPRTSLYYILPRLVERGFLEKRKIGTKTYWRKTSPKEYLENYQKLLRNTGNTNFSESNFINTEKVKIVRGINKLTDTLQSVTKIEERERFYGIQPEASIEVLLKKASLKRINEFNDTVKRKNLIVEGIVHEHYLDKLKLDKNEFKKLLTSFGGRTADYAKLPDGFLQNTKAEIYLWENRIAIMNWDKEFAVVIEDSDVFELIKAMFDSTKYMLDKYDQNEKIAKKLVDLS